MPPHICQLGTARIPYHGRVDQTVLDTTIKSGTGLGGVFAPTWAMVMQIKRGEIDWCIYTERYYALLRSRYKADRSAFLEALNCDVLIVCCYCLDSSTTTQHCHRYLLIDILESIALHHSMTPVRIGEIRNPI
jgi:hypothetical protein